MQLLPLVTKMAAGNGNRGDHGKGAERNEEGDQVGQAEG
jgi:hypothetical protein